MRALLLHPVQRGGGVEPAGEGDADFLADGQGFENYGHACVPLRESSFWLDANGYEATMDYFMRSIALRISWSSSASR